MHPVLVGLAGLLAGWWLWGHPRRLGDAPARRSKDGPGTTTTIIIPARDEARVLPLLLGDLAGQLRPGLEVVVVDDASCDDTAAVARSFGFVRVVAAPPLPEGWAGKSWACQAGVDATTAPGEDRTLVFLDADVRLGPSALEAIDAELARHGGLVSVQPHHTTERPYEQLSVVPGIVSIMGTGMGRRTGAPSGAFGPVLATSHRTYAAVGGHREVAGFVAEDVALGLRYRDLGYAVTIRLGGDIVRFRMYPAGMRQLAEGWTKNMASGASAIPLHRALLVALWVTGAGSATLGLPLVPGQRDLAPLVGIGLYAVFAAQIASFSRAIGTFWRAAAVAYPVALVTFVALFARSVWRSRIVGSVRWRGRSVAVGAPGGHA